MKFSQFAKASGLAKKIVDNEYYHVDNIPTKFKNKWKTFRRGKFSQDQILSLSNEYIKSIVSKVKDKKFINFKDGSIVIFPNYTNYNIKFGEDDIMTNPALILSPERSVDEASYNSSGIFHTSNGDLRLPVIILFDYDNSDVSSFIKKNSSMIAHEYTHHIQNFEGRNNLFYMSPKLSLKLYSNQSSEKEAIGNEFNYYDKYNKQNHIKDKSRMKDYIRFRFWVHENKHIPRDKLWTHAKPLFEKYHISKSTFYRWYREPLYK